MTKDFLNYCVVSPVKDFSNIFDQWLNNVFDFRPPPSEVIIASEKSPKKQRENFTLLELEEPYIPKRLRGVQERHYRIGFAREELRRYVIDNTSYNLIYLLDSDVIAPSYSPLILSGLLSLFKSSMVSNMFKHSDGYPPITLGCVMIERSLLELSLFYPHGRFSEDSVFYTSLLNLGKFGYKFKILYGQIFPVKHYRNNKWEESVDKFELKELIIGDYKHE
ncbi:MAG: hypothetical protein DRI61_00305 [Chloroflexi bacterium]|nr:MAG: hypothetical protein DRI61_00305 [Chloroflexota bacterium]